MCLKRKIAVVLAMSVVALLIANTVLGIAQGNEGPGSLGIEIESIVPEQGNGFKVYLSIDKGCGAAYAAGDSITISVRSVEAGYLTVYDFSPDGTVTQVFPNFYHQNNYIAANSVCQIPGPQDSFWLKITPPQGQDILKAIVTKAPGIAPAQAPSQNSQFPMISDDDNEFIGELGTTLGIHIEPVVKTRWGTATCMYYTGAVSPAQRTPGWGSIIVDSQPSGADVYWDGAYYWQTPVTIHGQTPGEHTLALHKTGYHDWNQQVTIIGGETWTIIPQLRPIR